MSHVWAILGMTPYPINSVNRRYAEMSIENTQMLFPHKSLVIYLPILVPHSRWNYAFECLVTPCTIFPVVRMTKYTTLTSSGTTVSTGTISASTISISTITPIITVSTIAIASITISSFGDGQATLGKLPHKRNDNGNSLVLSYVLSLKQCNTWCRLALN